MQNFIKTIINAVQSWTKKEIKNSTADWNQNDPSTVDYVKNRTHWSDGLVEEVVLKQQTVGMNDTVDCELIVGQAYEVTWDNEVYHCIAWGDSSVKGLGFGEFWDIGEGETVPFLIYNNKIRCESGTTHTISITTISENIHKLDSKYLDLPTNLATTDDVQEAVDLANNAQSTANAKMNKTNPVGTGSFSMNRKSGTSTGEKSVAIGNNTTASGFASHAEGDNCTASGKTSHAEGQTTVASGDYSHAEGECTVASGLASHAEGAGYSYLNTLQASGDYSHAEGYLTTASGKASHAEGNGCDASGKASHAEGKVCDATGEASHAEGYNTVAASANQHVQGVWNIKDSASKYAHIVGNGTSGDARSNAHTLDWNGVGWFQGGLQVGGTAQDDGAKNVLLEGDAIPVPAVATVGQLLSVKAVDENGKPTEWEAVDMPTDDHINSLIDAKLGVIENGTY